jgi:SNF family Na+-dependent transporter
MATQDHQDPQDDRDETEQERLDRKWEDQLQELRVMQTGVQLLAGFLLTLPFQAKFADLDSFQRGLFLGLMVIAALTTLCVMTPVSVHRHLSGQHIKHRVVATAQVAMLTALVGVALLVVGMLTLIFDVVVARTPALIVGGAAAVVAIVLLAVLPRVLERQD